MGAERDRDETRQERERESDSAKLEDRGRDSCERERTRKETVRFHRQDKWATTTVWQMQYEKTKQQKTQKSS